MTPPTPDPLLDAYADVRVADVRDALDFLGYFGGSLSPQIRPLWRTRTCGLARTVRYVPYQGPMPVERGDDYAAWSGHYYGTICTYPWETEIAPGDFIVIDQSGVDAGLMGSENTLRVMAAGGRGLVTNGGVRDTDEVILQQVPFWSAFVSQSMVQTRLEYADRDVTVSLGGATIKPGDVIVADGDGVIAVPRAVAADVAKIANKQLVDDKKARRQNYEALGRAPDETV